MADDIRFNVTTNVKARGMVEVASGFYLIQSAAAFAWSGISLVRREIDKTIDAFREYEVGLVQVGKIASIEQGKLKHLGEELDDLRLKLGKGREAIYDAAVNAARLGLRDTAQIRRVVELGTRLSKTTDLEANDAVRILARSAAVSGQSLGRTMESTANAISELGDNVAAAESEISDLHLEILKGTAPWNLAQRQVAAYAATMAELNIQSEIAGSSMGRLFLRMEQGVRTPYSDRNRLMRELTGWSSDEMSSRFSRNPADVVNAVLDGLGRLHQDSSGPAPYIIGLLNQLGIDSIRQQRALVPFTLNPEKRAAAMDIAFSDENAVWAKSSLMERTAMHRQMRFNEAKAQFRESLGGHLEPSMAKFYMSIERILARQDPEALAEKFVGGLETVLFGLESAVKFFEKAILVVRRFAVPVSIGWGLVAGGRGVRGRIKGGLGEPTATMYRSRSGGIDLDIKGGSRGLREARRREHEIGERATHMQDSLRRDLKTAGVPGKRASEIVDMVDEVRVRDPLSVASYPGVREMLKDLVGEDEALEILEKLDKKTQKIRMSRKGARRAKGSGVSEREGFTYSSKVPKEYAGKKYGPEGLTYQQIRDKFIDDAIALGIEPGKRNDLIPELAELRLQYRERYGVGVDVFYESDVHKARKAGKHIKKGGVTAGLAGASLLGGSMFLEPEEAEAGIARTLRELLDLGYTKQQATTILGRQAMREGKVPEGGWHVVERPPSEPPSAPAGPDQRWAERAYWLEDEGVPAPHPRVRKLTKKDRAEINRWIALYGEPRARHRRSTSLDERQGWSRFSEATETELKDLGYSKEEIDSYKGWMDREYGGYESEMEWSSLNPDQPIEFERISREQRIVEGMHRRGGKAYGRDVGHEKAIAAEERRDFALASAHQRRMHELWKERFGGLPTQGVSGQPFGRSRALTADEAWEDMIRTRDEIARIREFDRTGTLGEKFEAADLDIVRQGLPGQLPLPYDQRIEEAIERGFASSVVSGSRIDAAIEGIREGGRGLEKAVERVDPMRRVAAPSPAETRTYAVNVAFADGTYRTEMRTRRVHAGGGELRASGFQRYLDDLKETSGFDEVAEATENFIFNVDEYDDALRKWRNLSRSEKLAQSDVFHADKLRAGGRSEEDIARSLSRRREHLPEEVRIRETRPRLDDDDAYIPSFASGYRARDFTPMSDEQIDDLVEAMRSRMGKEHSKPIRREIVDAIRDIRGLQEQGLKISLSSRDARKILVAPAAGAALLGGSMFVAPEEAAAADPVRVARSVARLVDESKGNLLDPSTWGRGLKDKDFRKRVGELHGLDRVPDEKEAYALLERSRSEWRLDSFDLDQTLADNYMARQRAIGRGTPMEVPGFWDSMPIEVSMPAQIALSIIAENRARAVLGSKLGKHSMSSIRSAAVDSRYGWLSRFGQGEGNLAKFIRSPWTRFGGKLLAFWGLGEAAIRGTGAWIDRGTRRADLENRLYESESDVESWTKMVDIAPGMQVPALEASIIEDSNLRELAEFALLEKDNVSRARAERVAPLLVRTLMDRERSRELLELPSFSSLDLGFSKEALSFALGMKPVEGDAALKRLKKSLDEDVVRRSREHIRAQGERIHTSYAMDIQRELGLEPKGVENKAQMGQLVGDAVRAGVDLESIARGRYGILGKELSLAVPGHTYLPTLPLSGIAKDRRDEAIAAAREIEAIFSVIGVAGELSDSVSGMMEGDELSKDAREYLEYYSPEDLKDLKRRLAGVDASVGLRMSVRDIFNESRIQKDMEWSRDALGVDLDDRQRMRLLADDLGRSDFVDEVIDPRVALEEQLKNISRMERFVETNEAVLAGTDAGQLLHRVMREASRNERKVAVEAHKENIKSLIDSTRDTLPMGEQMALAIADIDESWQEPLDLYRIAGFDTSEAITARDRAKAAIPKEFLEGYYSSGIGLRPLVDQLAFSDQQQEEARDDALAAARLRFPPGLEREDEERRIQREYELRRRAPRDQALDAFEGAVAGGSPAEQFTRWSERVRESYWGAVAAEGARTPTLDSDLESALRNAASESWSSVVSGYLHLLPSDEQLEEVEKSIKREFDDKRDLLDAQFQAGAIDRGEHVSRMLELQELEDGTTRSARERVGLGQPRPAGVFSGLSYDYAQIAKSLKGFEDDPNYSAQFDQIRRARFDAAMGLGVQSLGGALQVIPGIDRLGSAVAGLSRLPDMWRDLEQMESMTAEQREAVGLTDGKMRVHRAATGAALGSGIGQTVGLATGRPYAGLLGSIGGLIGALVPGAPVAGPLIGSLVGSGLGALIKSGADEGLASIGGGYGSWSRITKDEKGLGGAAKDIGTAAIQGFEEAIDALGLELSGQIPALSIKVREGLYTIFIGSYRGVFRDANDAIAAAIQQLLKYGEFESELGPNARILTSGRFNDAQEFQRAFEAVSAMVDFQRQLDFSAAGLALSDFIREVQRAAREINELGGAAGAAYERGGREIEGRFDDFLGRDTRLDEARKYKDDLNRQRSEYEEYLNTELEKLRKQDGGAGAGGVLPRELPGPGDRDGWDDFARRLARERDAIPVDSDDPRDRERREQIDRLLEVIEKLAGLPILTDADARRYADGITRQTRIDDRDAFLSRAGGREFGMAGGRPVWKFAYDSFQELALDFERDMEDLDELRAEFPGFAGELDAARLALVKLKEEGLVSLTQQVLGSLDPNWNFFQGLREGMQNLGMLRFHSQDIPGLDPGYIEQAGGVWARNQVLDVSRSLAEILGDESTLAELQAKERELQLDDYLRRIAWMEQLGVVSGEVGGVMREIADFVATELDSPEVRKKLDQRYQRATQIQEQAEYEGRSPWHQAIQSFADRRFTAETYLGEDYDESIWGMSLNRLKIEQSRPYRDALRRIRFSGNLGYRSPHERIRGLEAELREIVAGGIQGPRADELPAVADALLEEARLGFSVGTAPYEALAKEVDEALVLFKEGIESVTLEDLGVEGNDLLSQLVALDEAAQAQMAEYWERLFVLLEVPSEELAPETEYVPELPFGGQPPFPEPVGERYDPRDIDLSGGVGGAYGWELGAPGGPWHPADADRSGGLSDAEIEYWKEMVGDFVNPVTGEVTGVSRWQDWAARHGLHPNQHVYAPGSIYEEYRPDELMDHWTPWDQAAPTPPAGSSDMASSTWMPATQSASLPIRPGGSEEVQVVLSRILAETTAQSAVSRRLLDVVESRGQTV